VTANSEKKDDDAGVFFKIKQFFGGSESKKQEEELKELSPSKPSAADLAKLRQEQAKEDIINELSKCSGSDYCLTDSREHTLRCDCPKDPNFPFACSNAIEWFKTHVLLIKIRKKLAQDPSADTTLIILQEYMRCEKHFQNLENQEIRPESAQ